MVDHVEQTVSESNSEDNPNEQGRGRAVNSEFNQIYLIPSYELYADRFDINNYELIESEDRLVIPPLPIMPMQMHINPIEDQEIDAQLAAVEGQVLPGEGQNPAEQGQNPGDPPPSPPCCTFHQTLWKILTQITRAQRYHTAEINPMSMFKLQKLKMRSFYLALAILAVCIFNLLCSVFQVIGMETHREFFSNQKFTDLLLLDDSFYPTYFLFTTYLTIFMTILSLNYIARPRFEPFFYHYLNFSQILLALGFIVFIAQLVSYQLEYPDEDYENELKVKMITSLNATINGRKDNGDLEVTRIWTNTQSIFKCCGVSNSKDWFDGNPSWRKPFLPESCCRTNRLTTNCTLNYAYKKGCLETQMKAFKSNEYRLHFGLLLQYIPFIMLYGCLAEIYAHSNMGQRPHY